MEGISSPHSVAEYNAFLRGLLLLCSTPCISPAHLRHDLLVGRCCGNCFIDVGKLCQQSSLDDGENLIPLYRFPPLIFTCSEVI
jgi:hypothetical protein